MSDNPQTPSPDGGSERPFSELSEKELDDLLAQAGYLADDLTAELGRNDAPQPPPNPDPVADAASKLSSLDDELAQLEELVSSASSEVGAFPDPDPPATDSTSLSRPPTAGMTPTEWDPESAAEFKELFPEGGFPPPPPRELVQQAMTPPEHLNLPSSLTNPQMQMPAPPKKDEADVESPPEPELEPALEHEPEPEQEHEPEAATTPVDDIPDFMREFLEPEPEPEPEPAETPSEPLDAADEPIIETTSIPVQMKPGVVGTGTLRKVVKPEHHEAAEEQLELTHEVVPLNMRDTLRARLLGVLRLIRKIPSPMPVLSKAALVVCDKGVSVLEIIDKPMSRLGTKVRILIGWLAMATLGTSVVVYIISLL